MRPLCVLYGELSCFYTLPLILGSFIPVMAVPETNLVVCNKFHPYSFPACENMSKARTLLLLIAVRLFDRLQSKYNHRCVVVEQVAILLCSPMPFLSRRFCHGKYTFTLF